MIASLVLALALTGAPASIPAKVQLAYFVPKDRNPAGNYEAKIRSITSVVSEVYRSDLKGKGYDCDGITFDAIQLVRGDREARHYNNAPAYDANEQWRRLAPEIRAKIGQAGQKVIVVFAETYDDGSAEHLWPGTIALGAYASTKSGLAIFSAHLLRDEIGALDRDALIRAMYDTTPIIGRKAWGQPMNSQRGHFIEDGTGAVAHELGHALGLPHDRREDALDIMGNGFRNLRWNFQERALRKAKFSDDCARLLMSSRYLAKDLNLSDNTPPSVNANLLEDGTGRRLHLRASDESALRSYVIVDRGKGSVVSGGKLTGTSVATSVGLGKGRRPSLQVIVSDDGGNQRRILVQ